MSTIGFGTLNVKGLNLVPSPPASITAWRVFIASLASGRISFSRNHQNLSIISNSELFQSIR
jgi:hypothetical protein